MINRQMKQYELHETLGRDKWGSPNALTREIAKIDCAINEITSTKLRSDIRNSEITHVGLTKYQTSKKGNILKLDGRSFLIELPPNKNCRYVQLFLKEVI